MTAESKPPKSFTSLVAPAVSVGVDALAEARRRCILMQRLGRGEVLPAQERVDSLSILQKHACISLYAECDSNKMRKNTVKSVQRRGSQGGIVGVEADGEVNGEVGKSAA